VKFLLDNGADVLAVDTEKRTPLHTAFGGYYNASIVEMLLQAGADIDVQDAKMRTPLNCLEISKARETASDCARLLVEAGADTSLADSDGKSVLDRFGEVADPKAEVKMVLATLKQEAYQRRPVSGDGTRAVTLKLAYDNDGGIRMKEFTVSVPEDITDELVAELEAALNDRLNVREEGKACGVGVYKYKYGPREVELFEEYTNSAGWRMIAAVSVYEEGSDSDGNGGYDTKIVDLYLSELLPGKFDRIGPKSAVKN
jgi:Ankyrin repeats (3 copies)